MKINKVSIIFKKALFPSIMTIISFVLFVMVYWLMTVRAIEPHFLKGLIFAIPFVCFGITTFLTVIKKLTIVSSTVITSCLIVVLGFLSFCTFIFMAFQEATTVTNDIDRYERVLKLTGYPNNELIKNFPNKIPENAKSIEFSYCPAFLQGGENFDLKFEADSDSINNYSDEFLKKAKWIGKWSDNKTKNNGIISGTFDVLDYHGDLPEDFTMYLFDSKSYQPNDWNHGYLSVVAISKQRNEIIFHSEQW